GPNGGWHGQLALGGAAKQITVGSNKDGRLEVFYVGTDNNIYHNYQVAPNGGWHGELALGGAAKQITVGSNKDGRLEVFYVGTDNNIYHNYQVAPNSGWHGQLALGGAGKQITVGRNQDGRLQVFYVGTNNLIYHNYQVAPNSGWHGQLALGGSAQQITVGANKDGRLEVFYVGIAQVATQRKSVTALSAPELMSLRRGVAKMMSRNNAARVSVDYRRSWISWAHMHNHFGNDCAGPIFPTGPGSGMDGVQLFTASNPDETATWCKCAHGATLQFLTWHRMYLWYFERVLQEAAGDPSLRLPYWDYETNGQLPAAYRDKTYVDEHGNTVANPLRVEARQPGLNDGTASLSASVTSTSSAMSQTTYSGFNSSLQATPHGAVH